MILHYFKVAIRNLIKRRIQYIINIGGLALGFACAVYVYLYIFDELSFDSQHPNADHTYRIVYQQKDSEGNEVINPSALNGWGQYMQENIKGIKSYSYNSRIGWSCSFFVTHKNGEQTTVVSSDVSFVMGNYTEFFYLDMIEGDKRTMLQNANDIVISETAAKELFGDQSALNRQIEFTNQYFFPDHRINLIVRGIFRDLPFNMVYGKSTKYLLNRDVRKPIFERHPSNPSFDNMLSALWRPAITGGVYFQTEPGTDLQAARKQLNVIVNNAITQTNKSPSLVDIQFIPIREIHFSKIPDIIWPEMTGNTQYIIIFLAIGVFILIVSCINFINLSIAQGIQRAKEVGLRKAMGSTVRQIIFQYLQEAFILTGVSMVLGLLIVIMFLQEYSDFTNKDFVISDIFSTPTLSAIFVLWMLVSLLSATYPAFFISSFNPISILKGESSAGKNNLTFRLTLIVFQFAVSFIFVFFAVVVVNQMDNMVNNDLNKAGDQILSIQYGHFAPLDKLEIFKNELSKDPELSLSSIGNHLPRREGFVDISFEVTVPEKNEKTYSWEMLSIGAEFDKVYGLQLVAGSFFSDSETIDSTEVIVNEEVARQLSVRPAELLGVTLGIKHPWTKKEKLFRIRGVIRDFKYKSIHHKIQPLILSVQTDRNADVVFYIKLPKEDIQEKMDFIQQVWKKVMPADAGFLAWFVSSEFNKLYFEENALYRLVRIFTVLAIITTCIGLFGMALFMGERKNKEMAIRKVMGANTTDVLMRMIVPFLKFMFIGCMLSSPAAFFFSSKWLDNFVYKIELNWVIVLYTSCLIFLVTLLAVSLPSFRIANIKPMQTLRQQ